MALYDHAAHALHTLNINAVVFNFSFEIGYVFTGYFVGYLFSSVQCPKLIKNGVYSSFCSFCITSGSIAILLHWVIVHPFLASFSNDYWLFICCNLVVCESWLNDRADNQQGQLYWLLYDCTLLSYKCGGCLLI